MFTFQLYVCWARVGCSGRGTGCQSTGLLLNPPDFEGDCGGKEGRAEIPKLPKRVKGSWLKINMVGCRQVEEGVGRWSR